MADTLSSPIAPGAVVGILGGGQLGRMLALAAARLGLSCHIYDPDPDATAARVAAAHTCRRYDDETALEAFARAVEIVTYEFENVPAATAEFLAALVPLRPGARALRIAQDRLAEKRFVAGLGIPVAPFAPIDGPADIERACAATGLPGVLKTRRFGYDGKGQEVVRAPEELADAVRRLGGRDLILEGFVPFALECSVIVGRGTGGEVRAYDPAENLHEGGILRRSTVPARIANETAEAARALAGRIADALDYVGVLGVELFVVREVGRDWLVVNEIAPRVHNSGHWTEDACVTSQFEQHIRAVAGWPLGSPERLGDAVMENLIGAEAERWGAILADPDARLHLYGKREARPGRKMGHVNRLIRQR